MTNVLIGSPIWSDAFTGNLYAPTLSGGSWTAGNPLTNLQDRRLHRVARSTDDARGSTQFTADLGANRAVRCVALVKHTLSDVNPTNAGLGDGAEVRVRGFTAPPILDAGGDGYAPFEFGWTASGTPTIASNAASSADGIFLDLIGDDDAGVAENYSRTPTFTGNGQKVIAVRVKEGTSPAAAGAAVVLRDSTAAADRLAMGITWSAGVPVIAQTTGTLLSSTLIGSGVYRLVFLTTSVTAANTNSLAMRPANTAAQTGNIYAGDIQAFDATTDPLVYDSGMTLAHPTGTTSEDRRGLTPTWVTTFPTATARYWRVNLNDDNNPAGSVDIGRLCITGAYEPSVNFTTGAEFTTESDSTTTYTDGGNAIHDSRPLRRVARFAINNLEDAEAIGQAFRQSRQMGPKGQCVLVLRPDATADLLPETTFLAVPREQTKLEYPYALYRNAAYAFTEEL